MKEKMAAYFSKFMSLTEEEAAAITGSVSIRACKKGDILLAPGQVSRESYFILQGCVRQYYLVDGEEKTSHFFTEEEWVISIHSFMNQVPADHYFDCIEDTYLVVWNEAKENDLYARFPKFETLSRTVLEKVLAEQQKLLASYVTDTPEQRYLRLLHTRPDLVQRVPQYQLAGYIGVKPESLSRIRKRIAGKNK